MNNVADDGDPVSPVADPGDASNGASGDAGFDETGPVHPREDLAGPVRSSGSDNDVTGTLTWAAEAVVGSEVSMNDATVLAGQFLLDDQTDFDAHIQDEIT